MFSSIDLLRTVVSNLAYPTLFGSRQLCIPLGIPIRLSAPPACMTSLHRSPVFLFPADSYNHFFSLFALIRVYLFIACRSLDIYLSFHYCRSLAVASRPIPGTLYIVLTST